MNPVLASVVVRFQDGRLDVGDIVGVLRSVEDANRPVTTRPPFPITQQTLPRSAEPFLRSRAAPDPGPAVRTAGRQAAAISAAGSLAGSLLALGPLPGAGRRAFTAVQVAGLLAMGAGGWTASKL